MVPDTKLIFDPVNSVNNGSYEPTHALCFYTIAYKKESHKKLNPRCDEIKGQDRKLRCHRICKQDLEHERYSNSENSYLYSTLRNGKVSHVLKVTIDPNKQPNI